MERRWSQHVPSDGRCGYSSYNLPPPGARPPGQVLVARFPVEQAAAQVTPWPSARDWRGLNDLQNQMEPNTTHRVLFCCFLAPQREFIRVIQCAGNVHAEGDAEDGGVGILRREGGAGIAREVGRRCLLGSGIRMQLDLA